MKKITHGFAITLCVMGIFFTTTSTMAATTPSLGMASSYAVLSDTYTNPSWPTTLNGDVGFTTAPLVSPLGTHTNYGSAAPYATAWTDQAIALSNLNGQGCTFTFAPGAVDLATDTTHGPIGVYTGGVYCTAGISSVMSIGTSGITLSGAGTFIFRMDGALNTVANSTVTLTHGANACDVFWTPNGATTLNANSTFQGTIIPIAQDITILNMTSWIGRALTFGHTVTTPDTNVSITVPTWCTTPSVTTGSLHIIKQVINNNGGTAISSSFNLSVKTSTGAHAVGSPASGTSVWSGTLYTLLAGTYVVSEDSNSSYSASFGGDCDSNGNVTLSVGQDKTCTITNDDIAVVTPPSWGGWGWGSLAMDNCPNGDYSTGYYDNQCGTAPVTGTIATGVIIVPTIVTGTTITPVVDIVTPIPTTTPTPGFPRTWITTESKNNSWNIIILINILILWSLGSIVVLRKERII